ncbi:MAG: deoxyribose-phosphate aldolase [Cloacibacterium sp.]|nr:deoxyribose-phosphate aldolase [Cloacibacterium sp.]
MNIRNFLDSTYLKTPLQSGLSEEENLSKVFGLVQEAVDEQFFAVMIRPDYIKQVKDYLKEKKNAVVVGTVIGFHEGTTSTEKKLAEAALAIQNGADELDFVINYEAYKKGEKELVKNEFLQCTALCLKHRKIAKWIIEIAALSDEQIANITSDIWQWAKQNFDVSDFKNIFVKSSTGFYATEGGKPNGATVSGINIMLQNAGELPVKAAGGVRTPQEAIDMISRGVKRIGTSSAKALIGDKEISDSGY